SHDRGRTDPRRVDRRHGHRLHAADRLRRERQRPGRNLHGLPAAHGGGDAPLGDRQDDYAIAASSFGGERRWRIAQRRFAGGLRERRSRCSLAPRSKAYLHAERAVEGLEYPEGEGSHGLETAFTSRIVPGYELQRTQKNEPSKVT